MIGSDGVIDIDGNYIIPCNYDCIRFYEDHIEADNLENMTDFNNDCIYYDLKGNPISKSEAHSNKEIDVNFVNISESVSASIPNRKIFSYNNSQIKYGWYEEIENESICRIKPIFDDEIRIRYTKEKKKYSIVQYGGLYGIIKFDESEV